MALSRLIVQLIRNRGLNQVWLHALRSIASRAKTDPDYAHHLGCVLTGLTPDVSAVGTGAAARIFGQAIVSPLAGASWRRLSRRWKYARLAPDGPGNGAGYSTTSGEFRDWAAGTGQALAELASQLARAKITRNQLPGNRIRLGPLSQ
jgi:hypothetical protein